MTTRVRPQLPDDPIDAPATVDGLCGHWAVGYVTARSLTTIIRDVGHQRPMTLREIVRELSRAGLTPRIVHRDVLKESGRDLWFANGADQFLAICCDIDLTDETALGHAVVWEGRRCFDPAVSRNPARVAPAQLAHYACIILCSRPTP